MKKFSEHIAEHVLSIGLNPDHEKYRKSHENDMHDVLRKSYLSVEGGYGGHGSGTKAESEAIRADLRNSNHVIKAIRRNDKITAVTIYKKHHGRKMIALGAEDSRQGKLDVKKTMHDDHKKQRSWAEVSGAPEAIKRKMGFPVVPSHRAKELTGKSDVRPIDKERYVRKIGNDDHEKVIMGYPKT